MLKLLTFSILILLVSAQCTIQKRLHNKGYSVSWNKKFQKDRSENDEQKLAEEVITPEETGFLMDTLMPKNSISENDVISDEQPVVFEENNVLDENAKGALADTVYIAAKNVPEGVAAISLLCGSIIGTRLAGYAGTYIAYLLIGCAAMFFASFILAIASMIVYRRYRKDYLTNVFGKLTFIVDLVVILLVGSVLILALFF